MSPQPLALTDEQITTIMQLSRPLLPDQRTAFVELLAAKSTVAARSATACSISSAATFSVNC